MFITDRGEPAYALPKNEDHYKLANEKPKNLLEVMDAVAGGNSEFEPPALTGQVRPADLS